MAMCIAPLKSTHTKLIYSYVQDPAKKKKKSPQRY